MAFEMHTFDIKAHQDPKYLACRLSRTLNLIVVTLELVSESKNFEASNLDEFTCESSQTYGA